MWARGGSAQLHGGRVGEVGAAGGFAEESLESDALRGWGSEQRLGGTSSKVSSGDLSASG